MPYNELRRDYLLNRWVVIATERSRRPTDFVRAEKTQPKVSVCPLCPGNEHMTPPAVLLYLKRGERIEKERDDNGLRRKDWLVRCVTNLYPAFTPPTQPMEKFIYNKIRKGEDLTSAVGHHEVLVESPVHADHPSDAEPSQIVHVINAYLDRFRELSSKPYVRYISIFRNHGLEAGASLSHAHSQIIATPVIPRIVEEELTSSEKYWKEKGECIFCKILEREKAGPRFIMENSHFTVFAPWASITPLEFWIFPKRHMASLIEISDGEVETLAHTLKACFSGLKRLLNDPPYNFGFHTSMDGEMCHHYHWHLEVYPKLSIWAGFEKSTGMYINTVSPETAAESLRKTILT
jgi:UDPglucose--hexose-1-phosphate uridylyltransferase